jgi:hypothetical protein
MNAVSSNVDRIQQRKIAREARRVAPPPMERSDDASSVKLGTIDKVDNELTQSAGAGRAVAAAPRINQIGQLGDKSE